MKRSVSFWSWLWVVLGALYFLTPLYATFVFSLRMKKDVLSFAAYEKVLGDPEFLKALGFSVQMAFLTIVISLLIIVPTAYWVRLKMPQLRPVVDFITVMPFVIPAIVLVFGLIRLYGRAPLSLTSSPFLLAAAYVVLSLPYMYRSVDTGLGAIDVRSLTEAAQSLGANWFTILAEVIFPNLTVSILSGTFLTLAIVIGELTMASMLAWPALGPYMALLGQNRAYEPAALAIMSFVLTWGLILLIQIFGQRFGGQNTLGSMH